MSTIILPTGTGGTLQPFLEIGGRVFTDLTNLITLYGICNAASEGNSTMTKANSAAGYPVTGGKTLKIFAAQIQVYTPASGQVVSIGYADTDIGIGFNTSFTNPVWCGAGAGSLVGLPWMPGNTAGAYSFNLDFSVPAGKYIAVTNQGSALGASVQVFGYET